jgi:hypothetical protein
VTSWWWVPLSYPVANALFVLFDLRVRWVTAVDVTMSFALEDSKQEVYEPKAEGTKQG